MSTAIDTRAVTRAKECGEKMDFIAAETLSIRHLRRMVRQTASLVSPGRRVRERMSNRWACDFENRRIFWTPYSPMPDEDFVTEEFALYVTAHEAGHLEFTGKFTPPNGIPETDETYFDWVNCIEDIRIERLVAARYPGFEKMRHEQSPNVIDRLHKDQVHTYPLLSQAMIAFLSCDIGYDLNTLKLDQKVRELVDRRWPELEILVDNCRSTDDIQRLAFPIFQEIMDMSPPDERQDSGQGDIVRVDPDSELGKAIKEAIKQGKLTPFRSGTDDDPDNRPSSVTCIFGPGAGQGVGQIQQCDQDGKQDSAECMADKYGYGSENDIEADGVDRVGRGTTHVTRAAGSAARWEEESRAVSRQTAALARQLQVVLRSNAQERWREGQRRGSLNTRRAYRSGYGDTKVFRKRHEVGGLNYVVGILPDISQSMSLVERRSGVSLLRPVVMIAEACEKAGIQWFVVSWDTQVDQVKHVRSGLNNSVKARLAGSIRPNGGTYEPPVLLEAENQFHYAEPGAIPILITISDGETGGIDQSRALLDFMTERMGVHDISVFIGDGKGPEHHDHQIVVNGTAELCSELPRVLKRIVRRKF